MKSPPSDLEAQVGSPSLTSAPTLDDVHWAIVTQGLDESFTFNQVALHHNDDGEQVWTRIRYHVWNSTFAKAFGTWMSMPFSNTVIGTGAINQVQPWDPSRPKRSLRVSLHDYKQDWLLTEAFLIPYILRDDANYVNNNKRFSINVSSTGTRLSGQDVIVIRKVLDKPKIARLLIFLLIISPALGIVVGLCTHKAGVGIAVSAGVFALASFLQGFTAWFHR